MGREQGNKPDPRAYERAQFLQSQRVSFVTDISLNSSELQGTQRQREFLTRVNDMFLTVRGTVIANKLEQIDRLLQQSGIALPIITPQAIPIDNSVSHVAENKPQREKHSIPWRRGLVTVMSLWLLHSIATPRLYNASVDITMEPFDKAPALEVDDIANPDATKRAIAFLLSLQPEGTYVKNSPSEEKVVPMDVAQFAIVMSKLKGKGEKKDFYLERSKGAMDWLLSRISQPGQPFAGSFPNEINMKATRWGRGEAVGMALRAIAAICQQDPEYLYHELKDSKGNSFRVVDTVVWMEQYLASNTMQNANGTYNHRPDYKVSFTEENVRMSGGMEDAGNLLLQAAQQDPSRQQYYLLEAKRAFESAKNGYAALQRGKDLVNGREFDEQGEAIWAVSYPDVSSYDVARNGIAKLSSAGVVTDVGIQDKDWREEAPNLMPSIMLGTSHLIKGDWKTEETLYKQPFGNWLKEKKQELTNFIRPESDPSPEKLWFMGLFVGSDVTIDSGISSINAGYVDQAWQINQQVMRRQRIGGVDDGGFPVGYEPFNLPIPLERIPGIIPFHDIPFIGNSLQQKADSLTNTLYTSIPSTAHTNIRAIEFNEELSQMNTAVAKLPPKPEKTVFEATINDFGEVKVHISQMAKQIDRMVKAKKEVKEKKGRKQIYPSPASVLYVRKRKNPQIISQSETIVA